MPVADAVSTVTPAAGDRTAVHKAVAVAALSLIVIGCAVGILVPAGIRWDFANFYDAGRRVAAGEFADLYHSDRLIGGQPTQGTMRFWSAPLSAALFAPLAWLDPESALIVFKVENTVVLFLALALLYRHCLRFVVADPAHRSLFGATFATLCLVYQPFCTLFRVGGQSTPTVLLLLVVALFSYTASRLRTAALLLTAAAMLKPSLAFMLVFLACVSGPTVISALVLGLLSFAVLSVAVMGWPIHVEFLRVLVEGSQLSRTWQYNSSLYVPIENLRLLVFTSATAPRAAVALSVLTWCLKLIVIGTFVIVVRRSRRQAWPLGARRHFEFLMAICFWLLVSQTVWEHYLAMLFVPLAYLVAARRWFRPEAHYLVGAIFALCLGQNLILLEFLWTHVDIQSIGGLLGIGLLKAGPLLLALVLLWRHHDSLYAYYTSQEWVAQAAD